MLGVNTWFLKQYCLIQVINIKELEEKKKKNIYALAVRPISFSQNSILSSWKENVVLGSSISSENNGALQKIIISTHF